MRVTLKARAGGRRSGCLSANWDKTTMRRRQIRSLRSWVWCPKFPGEVKKSFTQTPSQILAAPSARGPQTTVEIDPAGRPGHVMTVLRDRIRPTSFLKMLWFRLSWRCRLAAGLQVSVRPWTPGHFGCSCCAQFLLCMQVCLLLETRPSQVQRQSSHT